MLYSFVPSTLLATGLIYVIALYLRGRLRVGAHPRTHIEKEVAQAGPSPYARQNPGYTYRPAPPAQTYSAPPQVQVPQQVQPPSTTPVQPQTNIKFCIYCGKPMDARLQTCPNCNRGQW